jgi:microcystin-dependent protein
LGQISIFGFNFAPRGWAFCNGQILPIAQNTALFSLLGTTYGGNGQTTFALPNLQSRVPVHFGQGPGLSTYDLGQQAGVETVTLIITQIPAHTHSATVHASSADTGLDAQPENNYPAAGVASGNYKNATDVNMNAAMVTNGIAGGNQPHENLQPYLALNFCIALEGIFPSRN